MKQLRSFSVKLFSNTYIVPINNNTNKLLDELEVLDRKRGSGDKLGSDYTEIINNLIENSVSELTYDNSRELYLEVQYGLYHQKSNKLSNKINELVEKHKLKNRQISMSYIIIFKSDTDLDIFGY